MTIERAKIIVRGAVQGVGFRPSVFRLAEDLRLCGFVLNSAHGVVIEVEGERPLLDTFLRRLGTESPQQSVIQSMETSFLEPEGYAAFEIRPSDESGAKTTLIHPDMATCGECLNEVFDPSDRRHLYPFTNCTHCGPRFSIIEALPYDRPNTSMKHFAMCPACHEEYHDPRNRRFHAQPNACPDCGPQLKLLGAQGEILTERHTALLEASDAIRGGKIVALKGLGGFQLIVNAGDEDAVRRLRHRKRREEKPLAVMVPHWENVGAICRVSDLEARLLSSPEAPIVLLWRLAKDGVIAPSVAPGNPYLGVMLPNTPLHHLLLREIGFPVVATSGNLSDEPICIGETEAVERLRGIADCFLVHDRPIVRHVDDSVVRVLLGREQIMRRARGYAPLPIHVADPLPSILAVGAHLKNAVALSVGNEIFVSQHIGDLETPAAYDAFRRVCSDFQRLYDTRPERVACDLHPDYLPTKFAAESGIPVAPVQHHFAHVAACMAENGWEPPVLGIAWDGTGHGTDGTVWGGEFLCADGTPFTRVAHFRTFKLPGGEAAIREPRRSALGIFYEILGDSLFDDPDHPALAHFGGRGRALLRQAMARDLNTPLTSSAGRLFDAVASLLGIRQRSHFEGQAAMELEFAAIRARTEEAYTCDLIGSDPVVIDWEPMFLEMVDDRKQHLRVDLMAAKFHNALVEAAVEVARRLGISRVVLTGGCFQNRLLTEKMVIRFREENFCPAWHQRVPANDGGIALGQVVAASGNLRDPRPHPTTTP